MPPPTDDAEAGTPQGSISAATRVMGRPDDKASGANSHQGSYTAWRGEDGSGSGGTLPLATADNGTLPPAFVRRTFGKLCICFDENALEEYGSAPGTYDEIFHHASEVREPATVARPPHPPDPMVAVPSASQIRTARSIPTSPRAEPTRAGPLGSHRAVGPVSCSRAWAPWTLAVRAREEAA